MNKKRKFEEFLESEEQYISVQKCSVQEDKICTKYDAEWISGIHMLLPINKLIFWNLQDMKVIKVGCVMTSFHSDMKEIKQAEDWVWHVEYGYDNDTKEYELFKIYKRINNEFYTKIGIAINKLPEFKQQQS